MVNEHTLIMIFGHTCISVVLEHVHLILICIMYHYKLWAQYCLKFVNHLGLEGELCMNLVMSELTDIFVE